MIILAATPIGNDRDASPRLCEALAQADLIAAEDTRRLLNLAGRLGIQLQGRVIAYHDHNEHALTAKLITAAHAGQQVLMVSDAGMPGVSDPGFRLATQAIAENLPFTVVPGPSAPLTALTLSGISPDRFTFEGFVPRKENEQRKFFTQLAHERRTMIFFESPRRLAQTLSLLQEVFGAARQAAVCREMTKIHEEVRRGSLAQLVQWAQENEIRGEIVLVVAGVKETENESTAQLEKFVPDVLQLAALGLRLKDAAGYVAEKNGLRKNQLYQAALAAQ